MKKVLILNCFLWMFVCLKAQVPDAFQYKAVIRDGMNNLVTNQMVNLRFYIHQKEVDGEIVFAEKHTIETTSQGIVCLEIGKGAMITNQLSRVEWLEGPYFLEIEIDKSNDGNYVALGIRQLMSVPYAKYTNLAGGLCLKSPDGSRWNIVVDEMGNIKAEKIAIRK